MHLKRNFPKSVSNIILKSKLGRVVKCGTSFVISVECSFGIDSIIPQSIKKDMHKNLVPCAVFLS